MATDHTLSAGLAWLAVALVAGAILVVSVIPIPEATPEEGGGVPVAVLFHFVGYAVLAMALAVALWPRRLRYAIGGAFLGASVCGALVEVLQSEIPYRTFSYLDMAINAAGAATGAMLVLVVVLLHPSK
jgi:VanZ family protein